MILPCCRSTILFCMLVQLISSGHHVWRLVIERVCIFPFSFYTLAYYCLSAFWVTHSPFYIYLLVFVICIFSIYLLWWYFFYETFYPILRYANQKPPAAFFVCLWRNTDMHIYFLFIPYCQAQFQSSQVQSNLNWDLHYNHCNATPPHQPGQVYLSHFSTTFDAAIWYGSFIQPNKVTSQLISH